MSTIQEILTNITEQFKTLNNWLTNAKFVNKVANYVIDDAGTYAGITDNKATYLYIRLLEGLDFNPADKFYSSCSNGDVCEYEIQAPCRLVALCYKANKFKLEQVVRETFCRLNLTQFNLRNFTIELKHSILNSEQVFNVEFDSNNNKYRDHLTIISIDFILKYNVIIDNCCPVINLCDIDCE